MRILMAAAENGALPDGKVGGMGDVIRDLPRALVKLGHDVSVVMPSYGHFHHRPGADHRGSLEVPFAGSAESVDLYSLPPSGKDGRLTTYLLEHSLFSSCGAGEIYCDDPGGQPFARDSEKFALFSAAVADALLAERFGKVDVLHLHDWHVGTIAALLRLHPRFREMRTPRMVFTIHNLALQGVRPLTGDHASLHLWFPDLPFNPQIIDPRYLDCYNPLRAALLLSDVVNSVSPNYVAEISDLNREMGEGLGDDLTTLHAAGRLHGILNGCEYPKSLPAVLPRDELLALFRQSLLAWMGSDGRLRSVHAIALERLREMQAVDTPPRRTITCIGRLTDQKLGLLKAAMPDGRPAIEHMLELLSEDEELIILGTGQEDLEMLFTRTMAKNRRLLFLRGYSDPISTQLYGMGDLFLMPSLFEPCGIAQMLAMRSGQPCLVNRTGGLADTVIDEVNGFVFHADSESELAQAMITRMRQALMRIRNHRRKHAAIRDNARKARFPWKTSAQAYIDELYS